MNYSDSEFPWITVETFGSEHGIPETLIGCLLIDVRGADLDDPAGREDLAGRDGKDEGVIQHVMASPMAFTRIEQVVGQAHALLDFNSRKNFTARVLIGDRDGRSRAVVLGDTVAEVLNGRGIPTEVKHHHLEPQK